MNKNKNRYSRSKCVFVCASAILSLWLGATWTNNVKAAEVDANQAANNTEQTQQNTDHVTANKQDKTKDVDNQATPTATEQNNAQPAANAKSNDSASATPQSDTETVKNTTKVVVHYQGDGTKWVPYVWGKNPNSTGVQYNWDGQDDYGYYANITVDNDEQKIGVLIKGTDSWDKDGTGADRSLTVDDNGKAEVWYKEGSDDSQDVTPSYNSAKIKVHYHGNTDATSLNYWTDTDQSKKTVSLSKEDDDDEIGDFDLTGQTFSKIYVSPIGSDTETREFTPLPGDGTTDIYLVNKDTTAYYTPSFALAPESLASASMESRNTVDIKTAKKMTADEAKAILQMKDNEVVDVSAVDADQDGKSKEFKITTAKDLDILTNNQIGIYNNFRSIDIGKYVRSDEFDAKYYYGGDDLGATYTQAQTQIKLWAPTAKKVVLNLYDSLDNDSAATKTFVMTRGDKGVWSVSLPGDYKNWAYDYSLTFGDGSETKSNDPYSKAVTINGDRSVIEDYDAIKPDDFNRMPSFSSPTAAIIYETSIRDFTSDPNSGIKDKGKYLGMIESGVTPDGQVTGLDYLKSLGITHVQIMPMFDFASIDETKNDGTYNWGYDPKNYNVPEGSYSSNAADPTARIMEMKEMINGLHKAGIRVIMDVVYNHVYSPNDQALQKTVPGYYFEYDDDNNMVADSGCGNDTASERLMMRKYILDSVKYWAKNYNIDGFRFDIMSLLDTTTMNDIRDELNQIDPGMLLYGEGWDMRTTKREIGAGQYNADKIPSIGFFSDDIRNSVRSDEPNYAPGLVIGDGKEEKYEADAKKFIASYLGGKDLAIPGVTWQIHPYQSPSQTINYVACHDNRTLYDLLKWALPDESEANIIKRDKLATSMIMLAEGVPFVYSGQEALRTKDGNNNSYNAPIEVNEINWERVKDNQDLVNYFKELVNVRKSQPALRLNNYDEIAKTVKTVNAGEGGIFTFAYKEDGKTLYVVFNVNDSNAELNDVDLSKADKLLDSDGNVVLGKTTTLMPLSTLIAVVPDETPVTPETPSDTGNTGSITNTGSADSSQIQGNGDTDKLLPALDIVLTHNVYIYQNDGITTLKENGKNIVLKLGKTIHAMNNGQIFTFNGKKFYQIGENEYVKVNNTLKRKVLIHNAFVYTKSGKAIKKGHKHIVLKKKSTILALDNDKIVTIKGKKFYRIGNNKYVKVANVKKD